MGCLAARQRGTTACSARSVSAGALESFFVEQIGESAKKSAFVTDTIGAVAAEQVAQRRVRETQRCNLAHERDQIEAKVRALVTPLAQASGATADEITKRLAELETRVVQPDAFFPSGI